MAGPLAASGCCWATSDEENEQQLFYLFIIKLWNHYSSWSFENYNGNATISFSSYSTLSHHYSWISILNPQFSFIFPSFFDPPISDLCFHLNRERSKRSYNRDNYNMISITKLVCSQPIDQQEDIFPSNFQQEQDEFGFYSWDLENGHTANLRKSCSKNHVFLSVQAEFWQTVLR